MIFSDIKNELIKKYLLTYQDDIPTEVILDILNNRIDSLLAKRSNNSDICNRVDSLLDKCNNTNTEKEGLILEKSDDIFDEFLGIDDPVMNIRNILKISESNKERLEELGKALVHINEALAINKQLTHDIDLTLDLISLENELRDVCAKYEKTRFNGDDIAYMLYHKFQNNLTDTAKGNPKFFTDILLESINSSFAPDEDHLELFYNEVAIKAIELTESERLGTYCTAQKLFDEYIYTLNSARKVLSSALSTHPKQVISKLLLEILPKVPTVKTINYQSTDLRLFHKGICKYLDYEIPFELFLESLELLGFKYKETAKGPYYANFAKNGDGFLREYY